MTKRLFSFLPMLLLVVISSCESNKKEKITYFGGKIINPKSNSVVLYSMDKVIDTFYLNKQNKFLGKLKNANEGLYYFFHGDENQYIYLEPEDSLMLRLNTWDFDESLVFAGEGAERNNILIDCFLENEKDKKAFYNYNKLDPKNFKKKVDYLTKQKLKTYDNYLEHHTEETEGFKQFLKVALTFPVYEQIEKYPIIYAKYSDSGDFPELDKSFFDYRNSIQINKDSLMYYPPYFQYIRTYLYNKTYALGHPSVKSNYSAKFTLDLLKVIDKNIKSEVSKNVFLKQTVISHFYNKSSCNINEKPFNKFFELSTNEEDKNQIQKIVNDSKAVKKNNTLPDFNVINYSNTEIPISKIIKNKNVLLFFWSPEYYTENYITSRIKYLSKKYPKVSFIQIKIDGTKNDNIKKNTLSNQFYINNKSDANLFLTSKMPRCILVNKQGKVTNGYASFSSFNINPYLKALSEN
ncbi:hypothetical protein SAMN05216503_1286 [Polaribacter sp. KT25b]|uniref:hypothetical protein n=1 Tax=Polaribacter sp. KT25b TaxID=1855336 RepID=UPI000879348E|nr:hypothetical protein [Polaribacter sp. KT25b]SDR88919.1 hypothetical protein SAMN05216503_1286 [Polaribacter sp. KT25b]